MSLATDIVVWLSDPVAFPYRGPITASDCVDEFGVSKVAVYKTIKKLVAKGVLIRFDQEPIPGVTGPKPAAYFLAKTK